jgi:predicted DNA-binding transcriptional regulator YafY
MARGEQLTRQWRVIQLLINSQSGRSAADLAHSLNCHRRTVYRDLEALQRAGFPLYNEHAGGKMMWRILDAVKHHFPIPLDLTELISLYFSKDMLKATGNATFFNSMESLLEKIKTLLPEEYLHYLEKAAASFGVGLGPQKFEGPKAEVLQTVNEALIHQRYLEINYFTISRQEASWRRVAPYKVWFFDGTFYLIADCRLRKEVRIFAIERIHDIRIAAESFEVPSDFDADAFMETSFGVFQGRTEKVQIWFDARIAAYIKERTWHPTQSLSIQEDGSLIMDVAVAGTEEIRYWIMKWGALAKVLKPASLGRDICREASEMVAIYTTDGDRSSPCS